MNETTPELVPAPAPTLTVVEGGTAARATYRVGKVLVTPIFDKMVDGRKVAELGPKEPFILFEDPSWSESFSRVLAEIAGQYEQVQP